MKSRIISATEAARSFSEILNQVRYKGKVFEIHRGADAVAEIRPVTSPGFPLLALHELLAELPRLGKEEAIRFKTSDRNTSNAIKGYRENATATGVEGDVIRGEEFKR